MSNAYPIIMSLAILASLLWLSSVKASTTQNPSIKKSIARIDRGMIALVFAVIGARLAYVLPNLAAYQNNPIQILWMWDGGLSWIGGMLGAVISMLALASAKKQSFWFLLDSIAIPVVVIGFASWFGCLLDGCGYGKIADFGILTPPSSDVFGAEAMRYPVQGVGAIFLLLLLPYLGVLRQRKIREGVLAGVSFSLISLSNFILLFFRGDSVRLVAGIRLDAIATIPLIVLSLGGLISRAKIH